MTNVVFRREIKPYAEPIVSADLRRGDTYFLVNFVDDDMHVPIIETVVYIGDDLEPADTGRAYFQDIGSYRDDVRYGDDTVEARYFIGSVGELGHVFTFEATLDVLIACSIRRAEHPPPAT